MCVLDVMKTDTLTIHTKIANSREREREKLLHVSEPQSLSLTKLEKLYTSAGPLPFTS